MDSIPLPNKIQFIPGEVAGSAMFTIEPLFPGYGITIGNALRRTLLSSLPGAAVTAVKINGVLHEFTTVPHVKEDVLDILLNIKQLRLRLHGDEPATLTISVKGAKKITAAHIEKNARVEVMNPELHLATVTDPKGTFEAELTVERGRGYMPSEERGRTDHAIDTIAIDALFSPVRSVGLKIENVRVGQLTNFDKIIMHIETDGTIKPEDAVVEATKILIDHFNLLQSIEPSSVSVAPDEGPSAEEPVAMEEAVAPDGAASEKPKKRGRKKKVE